MIKILSLLTFIIATSNLFAQDNFIRRSGDKLMDGDKVFRFVGVNSPSITGPYDGYRNTSATSKYAYDPPELTFEMESYFKDMDQMGVTVFRNWGITVSNGSDDYEAFVEAPGIYNETAFRRIDKMLQLCNQYNMRVILCLVKENKYWGGTEVFSEMHGGTDYYSDPAVREGFKDLLYAMANRKNFYTGVAYKDDKAILAWEFGNEVPNSKVAWIAEMAKYLKSIDSNHLIADPRRANGPEHMAKLVNDVLVNIPEIDIVKTRQYPNYKGTVKELWAECEGKRPMIIDEFQAMDRFTPILEEIVETGTTGGLLWSLMKNQQNGGIGGHALFHAYSWGGSRWPGFNSGEYFNEAHNLMEIRAYSYKIRELPVPPLPAPIDPPFLFKTLEQNTASLKWQVAPGARYYFVERAKSKSGPWNKVSGNIDISYDLYFYPMFTDSTATIGESYFYRVIGANVSGTTPPSNIIGPIIIKKKLVMDNLRDFSLTYSHSDNLKINSETYPRLRQTEEDYFQAERTSKSSSGEIVYKADGLKSLALFVFSDKVDSITIEYSVDGKSWKDITNNVKKTFREGYPSPISGLKDNTIGKYTYEINSMPKQSKYVKIVTGNAGAADTYPWIGRVHIGYIGALNSDKD